MNAQALARRAYSETATSTRTDRGTEYELIARVTHRMKAAAEAGPRAFPRLAEALYDNRRLWTALAVDVQAAAFAHEHRKKASQHRHAANREVDVSDDANGLPADLRARIFYLSEFVQDHTSKVLGKKAGVGPILEVNTAILRGLSAKGAKT